MRNGTTNDNPDTLKRMGNPTDPVPSYDPSLEGLRTGRGRTVPERSANGDRNRRRNAAASMKNQLRHTSTTNVPRQIDRLLRDDTKKLHTATVDQVPQTISLDTDIRRRTTELVRALSHRHASNTGQRTLILYNYIYT